MSPRPSIMKSEPFPPETAPPNKSLGKTIFTGNSSFFVINCDPGRLKLLATVWTGFDACCVATETMTFAPKNLSEKNTQNMSYTNKQTRSIAHILMFGSRTWLTNAIHMEMPNKLFNIQWPETSQAATVPMHASNNKAWIRVNDFEQQRDTYGSVKPNCDFRYATCGDRQKKSDETEAMAVNAVRSCETEENR